MWWKFLIPSRARFRALGIVAVIIAMSGVFFLGYSRGQDRGFDNAYSTFQEDIRALDRQWRDTVLDRDEVILFNVSQAFNNLQQQIQQYLSNEERERELIGRLDVLSSTLQEMRNEAATADFGTCDLSPDFERLLNAVREATHTAGTP